jgi:hypothetical protein
MHKHDNIDNMDKLDRYKNKQHINEVNRDHETALRAEKTAKRLSKQALRMIDLEVSSAAAQESLADRLSMVTSRHEHDDPYSAELATNARLKEHGVAVTLEPGYRDSEQKNADTLIITAIDEEPVSTK